jgi:hypothetical protein
MGGWIRGRKGFCRLLPLGAAGAALYAFGANAGAETMSEIDAFQRAVSTQNRQDALAFIAGFGSSHLVPDLIELLRPEVAANLCADLRSPSPHVRAACDRVEKPAAIAVAVAPTAPPSPKTAAPASPTKGSVGPTVVAAPSAADAAKQTASVKAAPTASQAKVFASSPLAEPVPIPPVAATVKAAPTPSEAPQLQSPAFAMLPTATFAVVGDPPRSLPPAADSSRSY